MRQVVLLGVQVGDGVTEYVGDADCEAEARGFNDTFEGEYFLVAGKKIPANILACTSIQCMHVLSFIGVVVAARS